jgi:hypothetical protein
LFKCVVRFKYPCKACKRATGEQKPPDRIGDFGVVLSLDEALKYVAKELLGCFWH